MARFVDVDALMESFENVLGAAPCELNGYEIWEVLNAQERIDAIPVGWLRDKMSVSHATITNPFGFVLAEWLDEQEAR